MDPVLMVGAWAAALMAVAGLARLLWRAFVKAVDTVISASIGRVWRDMDDIEARLSALELSLRFVRDQLNELREMMLAHIEDK